MYAASPLTLAQVKPTLPPPGVAASVLVTDILEGQRKEQLEDPESLLLPAAEWPPTPPRAATQLSDPGEWLTLANELWSRGLVLWLPLAAIFAPGGVPVISGLFGVPKKKDAPGCRGCISRD